MTFIHSRELQSHIIQARYASISPQHLGLNDYSASQHHSVQIQSGVTDRTKGKGLEIDP